MGLVVAVYRASVRAKAVRMREGRDIEVDWHIWMRVERDVMVEGKEMKIVPAEGHPVSVAGGVRRVG